MTPHQENTLCQKQKDLWRQHTVLKARENFLLMRRVAIGSTPSEPNMPAIDDVTKPEMDRLLYGFCTTFIGRDETGAKLEAVRLDTG